MKKALVLAYDFPPCSAPGAAIRTQKLVRYLPEFGWDVSVICRDEGFLESEQEEPPHRPAVIRVSTPVAPRLSYQLGAWMWARQVLRPARRLVREARPDLVYVSCPPFPHALTAVRLARDAAIPLVVDFRDAWSLDPYLSGGVIKQAVKRGFCRWVYPRLERWVIERGDALVTNTPSMRHAYARLFRHDEGRIHLVPNGFDDADFVQPVGRLRRDRPLLLYCGRFSSIGSRSPELLLRGVRASVDAGRAIDLLILGDESDALRRSVQRFGLADFVRTQASVPNREAIRAVRAADILVVYQAPGRNAVTPVAGKTFEYLRAGRPILAIVPEGDNANLVRRYAAMHEIVTTANPAAVAAAIHALLDRSDGRVVSPDPEFLNHYSRRRIAEQISAIFDVALQISKSASRPARRSASASRAFFSTRRTNAAARSGQ